MALVVTIGSTILTGVLGTVGGATAASAISGIVGGTTAGVGAGIVGTAALGATAGGMAGASEADAAKLAKTNAQGTAANQAAMALPAGVAPGMSAAQATQGSGNPLKGLGGAATGGLVSLARGGEVPLSDGAYIIPADVVSALGNGSSKAGAEFLKRLMTEVKKEAVHRHGLGAAKKYSEDA